MRYATFVISADANIHPAHRKLIDEESVALETIDQITLLDGGEVVMLSRVRSGLERLRRLLESREDVLACAVTGGDSGLAYVRFQPTRTVEHLLTIVRTHEIILDVPITYTTAGGQRVTVVGEQGALGRAGAAVGDVVAITLERTGTYQADQRDRAALLTDRQREILTTAVELGYYQTPREATHEAIATELSLSPGTVGEHLRKIEARILPTLV
jgi:DNA-binding CsgD family transcriptional regulator